MKSLFENILTTTKTYPPTETAKPGSKPPSKPPRLEMSSCKPKPSEVFLFEDRKQGIFSGQSGVLLGYIVATDGDATPLSLFEDLYVFDNGGVGTATTRRALIRVEEWGEGDGRLVLVAEGAYVRDKSSTNDAHVDEDGDDE